MKSPNDRDAYVLAERENWVRALTCRAYLKSEGGNQRVHGFVQAIIPERAAAEVVKQQADANQVRVGYRHRSPGGLEAAGGRGH